MISVFPIKKHFWTTPFLVDCMIDWIIGSLSKTPCKLKEDLDLFEDSQLSENHESVWVAHVVSVS